MIPDGNEEKRFAVITEPADLDGKIPGSAFAPGDLTSKKVLYRKLAGRNKAGGFGREHFRGLKCNGKTMYLSCFALTGGKRIFIM